MCQIPEACFDYIVNAKIFAKRRENSRSMFNVEFLGTTGNISISLFCSNGWNVLCHCLDSAIHILFFSLEEYFQNLPAPSTMNAREKFYVWLSQI